MQSEDSAYRDLPEEKLRSVLESEGYVAGDEIVTTLFLSLRLGKPLLIEGEPGSGKTELGKVLAGGFDTELIRLQCYEGLAAESALYEWNYTKQLLAVQANANADSSEETVFSEEYLLERPLLRALTHDDETPPVLLIDEIDRADTEFEALLLEVLSDFQATIPEYGTVRAQNPPIVVITSNRTRGLSDALKRRCIYLHIDSPNFQKESEIVRQKVSELPNTMADEIVAVIQRMREEPLLKQPGVAETLDFSRAVATLRENGESSLSEIDIEHALGTVLKEGEDIDQIDDELLEELLRIADEVDHTAEKP